MLACWHVQLFWLFKFIDTIYDLRNRFKLMCKRINIEELAI